MNKVLACIVLLALIGGPFTPASRAAALGGGENLADMEMGASPVSSPQSGEVPGWPIPPKPVPHHEPGHLSKTSSYTTEVGYLNAEGLEETARLSGLDAMAADGLDPFSGNYTMVSYDQVLRSWYSASAIPPGSRLETLAISDTIAAIPGSTTYLGALNHDIAAGDVNNDGQLEQIVGWLGGNHLYLSVGETPGLPGKSSSAPAHRWMGIRWSSMEQMIPLTPEMGSTWQMPPSPWLSGPGGTPMTGTILSSGRA